MGRAKRMAKSFARKFVQKSGLRDAALGWELPRRYRKAVATHAVDPRKVLFVSGKLDTVPDSFSVMMPYLQQNYELDVHFVALARNARNPLEYNRICLEFMDELASAAYVFLEDASAVLSCVDIRPETHVVQLWHACGAFKKWGYSCIGKKFGGTRRQLESHPTYRNLSLVTTSSPDVNWAYREAMNLGGAPDTVQALGVSRTDKFYDDAFIERSFKDLYAHVPEALGRRVLLYAPTFRGRAADAQAPDKLDIPLLMKALGDGWVLLVKHHPFVKSLPGIPAECEGFAFDVSGMLPIDELLVSADALLTDYSSVVFEYALTHRPMCFFAYDLEDYDDWRGFYYSYDELTPGPVVTTTQAIASYVSESAGHFDASQVRAFASRFMAACDGRATERICDALFRMGPLPAPSVKEPIAKRLALDDPSGIDLSVIIPAYNAEGHLARALDSVISQPYPAERMEVIVVDDCSQDGTLRLAERYRDANPGLVRIAQTERNSGSGAVPRNLGLDLAQGTYVFFLDADDWLGEEAVPAMLGYAFDWGSDVLLVKMFGESGRKVPESMFDGNHDRVDIYRSKVMWTLGPVKLFRRDLIERQGIRFPTTFMPEDISFVLRAYVLADKVSVAADRDYYHCSFTEGDHLSVGTWRDLDSNLHAFEDIFGFVEQRTPAKLRDLALTRRLFKRDCYNMLVWLSRYPDDVQADYLDRVRSLFGPFYNERVGNGMTPEVRELFETVFSGERGAALDAVRNLKDADPESDRLHRA